MSYWITLEDAQGQDFEYGPFESIEFGPEIMSVNGTEFAKHVTGGLKLITNGGALGDAGLTGTTWPVLWGQAK